MGMIQLADVVYVVCEESSSIVRFSAASHQRLSDIVVQNLTSPHEQTSQLYVAEFADCVWWMLTDGTDIQSWLQRTAIDATFGPCTLSVRSTRLLVMSCWFYDQLVKGEWPHICPLQSEGPQTAELWNFPRRIAVYGRLEERRQQSLEANFLQINKCCRDSFIFTTWNHKHLLRVPQQPWEKLFSIPVRKDCHVIAKIKDLHSSWIKIKKNGQTAGEKTSVYRKFARSVWHCLCWSFVHDKATRRQRILTRGWWIHRSCLQRVNRM